MAKRFDLIEEIATPLMGNEPALVFVPGVGVRRTTVGRIRDAAGEFANLRDRLRALETGSGPVGATTRTVTATAAAVAAGDVGNIVAFDTAVPATLTVPTLSGATAASVTVKQVSTGQVDIAAGAGATVNVPPDRLRRTSGAGAVVTLARAEGVANVWTLSGDLALAPSGTVAKPAGEMVAGSSPVFTFTLSRIAVAWAAIARNGAATAARVQVSGSSGSVALDLPAAASAGGAADSVAQLWDAETGGTLLGQSAAFAVVSGQSAPAIQSPPVISGPSAVGSALTASPGIVTGSPTPIVSGQWTRDGTDIAGATGPTYTSAADDIGKTVRYRQDAANGVGVPASSTSNGIGPIVASGGQTAVGFHPIEGSGAAAGAVALFGAAFPRGLVQPGDALTLRRQDTADALRTQADIAQLWDDGSVKSAHFAAECPALADGVLAPCDLIKGLPHPSPGPALALAALLSGRSASMALTAADGTVWAWDVLAAVGADRWMQGPLCVSTRVETPVPPSAVGGATSVRAVADVYAHKDGRLRVKAAVCNDAVQKAGGAPATFSWRVSIDGAARHDQARNTLIQYSHWTADVAGAAGGGAAPEPPVVHADLASLVAAGFTPNWDTSQPFDAAFVAPALAAGAGKETDPYWPWGLARFAGQTGGRIEIGYRTQPQAVWLVNRDRAARKLALWNCKAAASRAEHFWDEGLGRWVNPVDWPKWTTHANDTSPAGTPRAAALGLPSDQRPAANSTDHITSDFAHAGSFYALPALLTADRMVYDHLASRAAYSCMGNNARANGVNLANSPSWRSATPSEATGAAWAPMVGAPQARGFAWALRDVVDAAVALPAAHPNRAFYDANLRAWINSYGAFLPALRAKYGALGVPIDHTNQGATAGFMTSFALFAATAAVVSGKGGPNALAVLEGFAEFRAGAFSSPDFNYRNAGAGTDVHIADAGVAFTAWAQSMAKTVARGQVVPPDWSGGDGVVGQGDWQRNVLAGQSAMLDVEALPLKLRRALADGLVLFRSERPGTGADPHPRIEPWRFPVAAPQSNCICAAGTSWRWDIPPSIRPGQSFQVEVDAAPGSEIGLVRTTGAVPRASAEEGSDAWVVASQPAGDFFSVSRGGCLLLASQPPVGQHTVHLYCRTFDNSAPQVEQRSATVAVTVNAAAIAPAIAPAGPWTVGSDAARGALVGRLAVTGTTPRSVSIASGDPDGVLSVDAAGEVRVALADISSRSGATLTPTFSVTGPGGTATRTVTVNVVAAVAAPVIAAGQVFEIEEGQPAGSALSPAAVSTTGGPVAALSIVSGDAGSRFAAQAPNVLKAAAALSRADAASYTLGLRAENTGGFDEETVTVNVRGVSWVFNFTAATEVVGAYDVSQRLRAGYSGPLFRAVRLSDNAEQDWAAVAGTGLLDEAAFLAWAGGGATEAVALYDQSPRGNHFAAASANGRPRITDAAGAFFTIGTNNRPGLNVSGGRGLKRAAFTVPAGATDLAAFAALKKLGDTGGSGGDRVLSLAANETASDSVNPGLNFSSLAGGAVRVGRFSANVDFSAAATGASKFVGVVTSNEAGWGRRVVIHPNATAMSGAVSLTHVAVNAPLHARLGYFTDAAADRAFNGTIGRLVVTAAVEKAADIEKLRANFAARYGL